MYIYIYIYKYTYIAHIDISHEGLLHLAVQAPDRPRYGAL